MTDAIRGLLPPITTPFDAGGSASPARLAAQIEIYGKWPLAGVVLFGTSGEGPLLGADEERGRCSA